MKKGLLLFFMLVLVPIAYSSIVIDGPDKSIYNLGDDISIAGYVITSSEFTGFLGTTLNCNETTFNLPNTVVSLNANEKKNLQSDIQLPKLTISSSVMPGTCAIKLSLIYGAMVVDSALSKEFQVQKDLKGDFSIDKDKLQIGKTLKLIGNVYKLNGNDANGVVEIYFKNNETKFLIDIATLKDGRLEYEYKVLQIPEGSYTIDLFVNDLHGNQMLFENVTKFTVISKLSVSIKAAETLLKPGDKVKVYGDVKSSLDNSVLSGIVKIKMDGNEYSTQIKNNKFEYIIDLAQDIKSNEHIIEAFAEDLEGNSGTSKTLISIIPIEKELKPRLNKNEIMPKETLEITPLLYDQANNIIKDTISIEVYDPKNKLIFSDSVKAGMVSRFIPTASALPGAYSIRLGSTKLKSRTNFQVGITADLVISLENQSVVIENIGNSMVETIMKFMLNPNQVTFVKKISLRPEKLTAIDLSREITSSGIYDISISYDDNEKTFRNVPLTARKRIPLDAVYYTLAIALFAAFVYLLYIKVLSKRKTKHHEAHEKAFALKELKRLRELKSKKGESRFSYKNMDKSRAIDDFKKSYVDSVKEPETRDNMFGFMDRK